MENVDKIALAKAKYNAYGCEWTKAYFDEDGGGYNVYHVRHCFSPTNGGGEAEKTAGKLLAKSYGKQIEFMPEGGEKGSDWFFDAQTWELKFINHANKKTIRSYLEEARHKKSDNVIFYWTQQDRLEDLRDAVDAENGSLAKRGKLNDAPNVYYIRNAAWKIMWKK